MYGHRNRGHFLVLKDLKVGDAFSVTTKNGKSIKYVVESIDIVKSDSALRVPISKDSRIMLTTCYPFYYSGHAPEKWVVIGKNVYK